MSLCSAIYYPSLKQGVALAVGAALLIASSIASANRITLVVTMNKQSALAPASWAIFTAKDKERKTPVATLPRHSGIIDLPAGHYCAKVQMDKKSGEAEFRVESNVDRVVNIALD